MRNYILSLSGSIVFVTLVVSEVGTVKGHVYTGERNDPVVEASVYLESLDRPSPGRPSISLTDGQGKFVIEAQAGKYAIHAFKPDDGYPDTFFAFNLAPNQKLKEITVAAGQVLDGIDVKLGPKPAVLSFYVTDSETGSPLSAVDYELCQVRHPDWCLRGGAPGKTDFSAPPTEISIQLGAQAHQTVKYVDNGKASVSLSPGERREIRIALKRNR